MPQFYTKYSKNLAPYLNPNAPPPRTPVQANPADLPSLQHTPGGQVLATNPATFQQLFNTFTHNVFTDQQFRWDPSAGGSYTNDRVLETLDGTRNAGECKILATALYALWAFPPPFGLGQAGASVSYFNNNNANDGFIAPHPRNGIRGLRPNIMHPWGNTQDLNTRQPLYQWGDHKVVLYQNRYYDPSYKAIFNNTNEMVAFRFTGAPHPVQDVYPVRVVTATPDKGWQAGQVMYMRFDLMGGGWKGPYRDIS